MWCLLLGVHRELQLGQSLMHLISKVEDAFCSEQFQLLLILSPKYRRSGYKNSFERSLKEICSILFRNCLSLCLLPSRETWPSRNRTALDLLEWSEHSLAWYLYELVPCYECTLKYVLKSTHFEAHLIRRCWRWAHLEVLQERIDRSV